MQPLSLGESPQTPKSQLHIKGYFATHNPSRIAKFCMAAGFNKAGLVAAAILVWQLAAATPARRLNAQRGILRPKRQEVWTKIRGGAVLETRKPSKKADAKLVLSCIASYAWRRASWRSRVFLVLSATFLLMAKALNVMVPGALQKGVDALSTHDVTEAARWMTMYCLTKVAVSLISEMRSTTFSRCSQRAIRAFSADVFAKLHALDADYHSSHPVGEVSIVVARGARGFASLAFLAFFSAVPTLVELALSVRALGRRSGNSTLGAVALVTFVAYAAYTAMAVEARIATRKQLVELETRKGRLLGDSLANHDAVKATSNELVEVDRFDDLLGCIERLSIKSQMLGSLLNFGQAAIFSTGLAVSLAHAVASFGRGGFSLGDVVAVNALLLQLSQPMNFLGYTVSEIRQGLVDTSAMLEILQQDSSVYKARTAATILSTAFADPPPAVPLLRAANVTIKEPPPPPPPWLSAPMLVSHSPNPDRSTPAPEIRFVDVWSSRNGGRSYALKGASFVAPAGRCTCLVGSSGSGKSTALRLCALLDGAPVSGSVTAWGLELATQLDVDHLRRRLALVPQSTDLFDSSSIYNIRYGDLSKQPDDARQIGDELLHQLDLDAPVGERGLRLSGGERQRVLIARALLRDAPLLIADEPTAAQDAQTEADVVTALLSTVRQKGRTLIVVAHRLAAIAPVADRIVVFKDGKVVQQGTHRDLLRQRKGEYARLWKASNRLRTS